MLGLVFDYIGGVLAAAPVEKLLREGWDENTALSELRFRFAERLPPFSAASSLAHAMQDYPEKYVVVFVSLISNLVFLRADTRVGRPQKRVSVFDRHLAIPNPFKGLFCWNIARRVQSEAVTHAVQECLEHRVSALNCNPDLSLHSQLIRPEKRVFCF